MKKKEIISSIKEEFLEGAEKSDLFKKYSGMALTDRKLAYVIATLKDDQLSDKHKVAHFCLLTLMVITILFTLLTSFVNQFPMWLTAVVLMIGVLFFIGFIKKSHLA